MAPPIDLTVCQQRQQQVLCAPVVAALTEAAAAGSLTYFELAARDCRNAIAGLSCDVGLEHDLLSVDACRAMVTGEGEDGDPCALSLACADGFYCAVEDACPGRCRAYRQNNETCSFTELCAPDTFCSVVAMRCHARVDLNGACELTLDNNPCREGTFCDGTNPSNMRCVPVRGRGQGCNSSFECIAGARCVSNRCSAGVEGDVCNASAACAGDLACAAGACVVPLKSDAPCSDQSLPCGEGLVCTSSVGITACHPRPARGGSCASADCYLSRCQDALCAALVLPEEACAGSNECFPGHACRDGICKVEPIACTE